MQHINTYQCKNPIVPKEGWFGQPKYSTSSKDHPTLCRFLLLYSFVIVAYGFVGQPFSKQLYVALCHTIR